MRNSKQTMIQTLAKGVVECTLVVVGQALLMSCTTAQQAAAEKPTPQYMASVRPVEVAPEENSAEPLPYGFTIDNKKDSVVVSMDANPTTGYSWSYTMNADSVLQLTSSKYVANKRTQGTVGAGGRLYYAFSPLAAGDVTIRFIYARSRENATPTATITVLFFVAADGTITWKTPKAYQR